MSSLPIISPPMGGKTSSYITDFTPRWPTWMLDVIRIRDGWLDLDVGQWVDR